jgi:Xaa-Pro aminopeptidase
MFDAWVAESIPESPPFRRFRVEIGRRLRPFSAMRYDPIHPDLFRHNRECLRRLLPPNSLAILNANDPMPTNADGTMGFRQNSDLFHLTGVDQEETILVLFPNASDEKHRELLFLRETSELIAIWEGRKLTKEEACKVSGVEHVHWLSEFPALFRRLMCECEHVYLNTNEHKRADITVETRDARFVRECQRQYPLHDYQRLARLMHKLRMVKSEREIELIRRACDLTARGFKRVLRFVEPGVGEWEIEAELAHEFIRRRGGFAGYQPIIASGANACVLHYFANDQVCRKGELLLLDFAAGWANYQSDLTRTIPVSGRFTRRQKQVYRAVLRVLRESTKLLTPGRLAKDWQTETEQLMERELVGLGLLTTRDIKRQDPAKPAFKKYFMHGIGHPLGLDVHDVGNTVEPLPAGAVMTCEPGIYIPEEGFAVRLENDILLTDEGPVNLMEQIPIEVEEIEEKMNP